MGNGTEDIDKSGPAAIGEDNDWVVECSDDETYNPGGLSGPVWEPLPEDVKALYTRLTAGESLTLEWTCPGRRSPSPEKTDNQASDVQEEPEQQKQEERILPTGFDFDEDLDKPGTKPGFTPRRTPGSGQTPRSQKKRVARMDKIMNDILRHKKIEAAERKASPGRRPMGGTPTHRRLGALGGQRRIMSTPGGVDKKQAAPAADKSFAFDDSTEGPVSAPGETRTGQPETAPNAKPTLPPSAPTVPSQGSIAPSTAQHTTTSITTPKSAQASTAPTAATPTPAPVPTSMAERPTDFSSSAPVPTPPQPELNESFTNKMGNLMSGNPAADPGLKPQVAPVDLAPQTSLTAVVDKLTANPTTAPSSTTPQPPSADTQSGQTPTQTGPTQAQVGPTQPQEVSSTTTPEEPSQTQAKPETPTLTTEALTQEGPTTTPEGPTSTQEGPAPPPTEPITSGTGPTPMDTAPNAPVAPPSVEVAKPDSVISQSVTEGKEETQTGSEPQTMETDSTDEPQGDKAGETATDNNVDMKDA